MRVAPGGWERQGDRCGPGVSEEPDLDSGLRNVEDWNRAAVRHRACSALERGARLRGYCRQGFRNLLSGADLAADIRMNWTGSDSEGLRFQERVFYTHTWRLSPAVLN